MMTILLSKATFLLREYVFFLYSQLLAPAAIILMSPPSGHPIIVLYSFCGDGRQQTSVVRKDTKRCCMAVQRIFPFRRLGGSIWAIVYEDAETITNENLFEGKISRFAAPNTDCEGRVSGRVARFELSSWCFTIERPLNALSMPGGSK